MRKLFAALAVLVVAGVAGLGALVAWPLDRETEIDETLSGDPDRGAYLARASGCIGCHTDIENGGPPLAGGPAIVTDFGTFRAPNITTDTEHGIGAWSLGDFATAVRHGISPEGHPYYPAFPYEFYTKLSDQDVADLYAAFQTVAPVAIPAPAQEIAFPFSFRPGLKLWRDWHFESGRFSPDPSHDAQWNRGAFLVEGPGHCAACHTPRNVLGGLVTSEAYAGSRDIPGGDNSPAITPDALAEGDWDEQAIAVALRMGVTPDGDTLGGTMGEVVRDSTSFLTDEDLNAIAIYLLNRADDQ
jgi:mono/diheme cytochrome c family protein